MYDAIVIGARAAGAPTAMLLARNGHRVLVVDRATFPSDTLSTHFMQPDATERLKRWGLLDRILANGAPEIWSLRMSINGIEMGDRLSGSPLPALCPRRGPFDLVLVEGAREAGAEVREGFHISELTRDATGRVTGIVGKGPDGVEVTETATIVIGADGKASYVAKQVQAEEYDVRDGHTCGGYLYMEGVPNDGVADLHLLDGRMLFLFPTDNGQVCVGTEWPNSLHDEFRKDPLGNILSTLDKKPEIGSRVRQGTPIENVRGLLSDKSYFRKSYGPGWALVGDAGYLKDPITGLGMADALRDAEVLAGAVHDGLSGAKPMEEALAGHQEERDGAAKMMYEVTYQLASLNPPEALVQMMAQGA